MIIVYYLTAKSAMDESEQLVFVDSLTVLSSFSGFLWLFFRKPSIYNIHQQSVPSSSPSCLSRLYPLSSISCKQRSFFLAHSCLYSLRHLLPPPTAHIFNLGIYGQVSIFEQLSGWLHSVLQRGRCNFAFVSQSHTYHVECTRLLFSTQPPRERTHTLDERVALPCCAPWSHGIGRFCYMSRLGPPYYH